MKLKLLSLSLFAGLLMATNVFGQENKAANPYTVSYCGYSGKDLHVPGLQSCELKVSDQQGELKVKEFKLVIAPKTGTASFFGVIGNQPQSESIKKALSELNTDDMVIITDIVVETKGGNKVVAGPSFMISRT